MSYILSVETSTPICSIAIHQRGGLLGNQSLYIDKSHSGLLVPSIQSLIKYCGLTLSELDAIAVSKGPGSYTGLRIGVSTVKGLCHALDVPLIAVNTLKAMANGMTKYINKEDMLCPMLDARRMEVYSLVTDSELDTLESTTPRVIDEDSYKSFLEKGKVYFFGNGAEKCKEIITHPNAIFIEGIEPDATHIGTLAYSKYKAKKFEDLAYFDPFYLKEFKATKPKAK